MKKNINTLSNRLADMARHPDIRVRLIELPMSDFEFMSRCAGPRLSAKLDLSNVPEEALAEATTICRSFLTTCELVADHLHLSWVDRAAHSAAERTIVLKVGPPPIVHSSGLACLSALADWYATVEEVDRLGREAGRALETGDAPDNSLGQAMLQQLAAAERVWLACGWWPQRP